MTRTAILPALITKEIRALLAPCLVCIAAILATAYLAGPHFRGVGLTAYFLGIAALGALSIGHEYSHGTLATLLSQPVHRGRVLLTKLGVLLPLLVLLAVVAELTLLGADRSRRLGVQWEFRAGVLWVLCVAPWLTMLTRSPIAGTVFTMAVPGVLLVAGELLAVAISGLGSDVSRVRLPVFWTGMLGLGAIGAVMGTRRFMRLEAIDERAPDIQLPAWLRRGSSGRQMAAVAPRHWAWLLVKKELHLQQMAFVISGIYLLGWVTALSSASIRADAIDAFNVITAFYAGLLALIVGSLASAEERQLGTLQWQLMLPVATVWQWVVKVATALGLTLVLGLGLPALLAAVGQAAQFAGGHWPGVLGMEFAVILLIITTGALYISSLCTSGIQAMLVALAGAPAVALLIGNAISPLESKIFLWAYRLTGQYPVLQLHALPGDVRFALLGSLLAAIAAFIPLRFALTNQRAASRSASLILKQIFWMAASLTVVLLVWLLSEVAASRRL